MEDEETTGPFSHPAAKMGMWGMVLIALAIAWVFIGPAGGMIGPAEALAFIGVMLILGAAWRAANSSMEEE